jgi:hypothetical protein
MSMAAMRLAWKRGRRAAFKLSPSLLLAVGLLSCGGGNPTAQRQPVSLTITPGSATLSVAQTQQFNVTVLNDASNSGVFWQVNGIAGGSAAFGSISPDGLYTAPAVIPNPTTFDVSAVSQANKSASASARVTITAASPISITISPTSPSVPVNATQNFSATVQNDVQSNGVSWSVTGCSGAACGTLTDATPTTVTYHAPASSTTNVVTATSVTDGTKSASATVAVTTSISPITVSVSPKRAAVTAAQPLQFTATVTGDSQNLGVTWTVDGNVGGSGVSGTISPIGLFTPGTRVGVHTVTAVSVADPSKSVSVSVAVTDLAGVFTYHNDAQRTGLNAKEYALSPTTISPSTFGVLFSCALDTPGFVYAQPLYVANLTMGDGQKHNVIFVATESDWVYAFDADSSACRRFWSTRVLKAGDTTVPPADTGETGDLLPEIGVTSTPVIDPATNTIYVCAKAKDSGANYHHRLYALDLVSGAAKLGSPVEITAPDFVTLFHLQRPALLLDHGAVYIAFGSHGDHNTYQGWLMAYDASTLARKFAWPSTDPTGANNEGAIWQSGNGPSTDASGNVYVETGNGAFDADVGGSNYSDSVVKLSSAGSVADFFTPFDQSTLSANDVDLGSSGVIVLPDALGSTAHPRLALATGKTGILYLLDRDDLGNFHSGGNQDVQEVTVQANTTQVVGGIFGQPAIWNGNLYVTAVGGHLKQYSIANGTIAGAVQSQSGNSFGLRGATPVASASGATSGVVWILDISAYPSGSAVLYAYDAANLANQLYASPAGGTGAVGVAVKFAVPTVANGKVYVGGQGSLTVFGLRPN